jgi:hypothetical protein
MLLRPQRNSDDLQKRKSLDHFEDQDLDKEWPVIEESKLSLRMHSAAGR